MVILKEDSNNFHMQGVYYTEINQYAESTLLKMLVIAKHCISRYKSQGCSCDISKAFIKLLENRKSHIEFHLNKFQINK